MRTVLHLIDTDGPGGAETVFVQVAAGMAARRWGTVAAVPGPGWPHDALRARRIEPLSLRARGGFDAAHAARLALLLRRRRVDLVHAHLLGAGVYATLAGVLAGVPVVTTLHGAADVPPDERHRRLKLRLLGRRANRVVFVSAPLRDRLMDGWPLHPARTAVVHNGIDAAAFRPGRDDSLRRELGIAPGALLLGAVGNLRPDKDYPVLLHAAARLREHLPGVRLVVAGEGGNALEAELRALATRLGLGDTVVFAGFRADPERVLRALDLFVLSSRSEGFSLSTVQAMACGLPVVATRSGGPEEIVADGRTGILVAPGSPDALADAVLRLARDPEARARLGRAAREEALARFTLERMVRGYEAVYAECLGAASPARVPALAADAAR